MFVLCCSSGGNEKQSERDQREEWSSLPRVPCSYPFCLGTQLQTSGHSQDGVGSLGPRTPEAMSLSVGVSNL
ncbi:Uncharacterized protein DAT39_005461 [Clarias magur]|uniref:Uncharacterized protein n=1 Tax=Clarias magur TaxID=1594786 RepID=A0A8J4TVV2_CLAMG|nr:Uncharacterized protein DAT39_005461 [Clarias magur]